MIIESDKDILELIEGKKIVLYTPNTKGEMPNAAVKQFIPSSIMIRLDNWFVGYTPEIIDGFNMIEIDTDIAEGLQYFNIINGSTVKYDVYGNLNPESEKKVITMTEEQIIKQVTAKKKVMILETNRKLDSKLTVYFNQFSNVERNTWNSQLAEAQAYLKDHSVETPMLQIISTLRGLTLDEMVNKVIKKSNEYQTMVANLIAEKQILESKIQAANTNEELNNLLIDLNNY